LENYRLRRPPGKGSGEGLLQLLSQRHALLARGPDALVHSSGGPSQAVGSSKPRVIQSAVRLAGGGACCTGGESLQHLLLAGWVEQRRWVHPFSKTAWPLRGRRRCQTLRLAAAEGVDRPLLATLPDPPGQGGGQAVSAWC